MLCHHMIDYLEADEEPHDFVSMAAEKMDDIASRGKLPILVGGSTSLTIPLLHEASKRQYRMMVVILVPGQSTYQSLIQARADEMLEMGLLDELAELKHLEQTLLGDEPNFDRGVWKTIGYPEFYSYLQSDTDTSEHGVDPKCPDINVHQYFTVWPLPTGMDSTHLDAYSAQRASIVYQPSRQ